MVFNYDVLVNGEVHVSVTADYAAKWNEAKAYAERGFYLFGTGIYRVVATLSEEGDEVELEYLLYEPRRFERIARLN